MNLIIPVSFMIDNKTFLTKQFHEKDIRRVGLEWADKGTLSFLSADQFRNLIQSGKIRPGKRSAQSSGFRFNQGSVNKEETVPMPKITEAEKLIQTAQIALGSAGVISEKQTPERKAQLAKRIADLKRAMNNGLPNGKTKFDLAHWQETDTDEKADTINTFDTRGKIINGGVVSFKLDGKPLMVLTVSDVKAAIKNWVERGALPVQAKAPGNYLVPFLFRGDPQQGNLYKKGQRRDAKQVTKSESAEKQGDSLLEGKDYFAVEGTVDGQAAGAQTAPTSQEAEHYAEAMLAYLKKQSPKAKKITVHIFKVVNYQRKGTPLKVLKAESTETEGDTIAEGKAVKIGRLTFESFTNGSISGWWVKHITVVKGQGVWKTNTLGWIEERKSTKTSLVPSFLWLEKGNGEENIKALVIWPKGHATGFPNKDVGGANITRATTDGTSGMLQATAKWIQERRPDLVKEETLEPELTESQKILEASQVALGRAGVISEAGKVKRFGQTVAAIFKGTPTPTKQLKNLQGARWEKEYQQFLVRLDNLQQNPVWITQNKKKYEVELKRLTKEVQEWYKVLEGSQEGYELDMKRLTQELKMTWGIKESLEQVTEEKQAPKITEKMIRDDMGLGSQDIGKGAMQILRSGWCANCDKEWYAVVFLAKNRVWWAEINGLDRHATYKNMGKRNLHNAALAKFDSPGKWKDDAGRKYVPVTDSVLNLKKKIRPDTHPTHHLTTEGADQATPITEKMIRDDLGYARIQFMRAGWCADCDKAWYAAVFIANSKKTYWAEISAGDKHPTYTDFGSRMGSKALEKFDRPGKWRNTVPALKSPFKS